VSAEGVLRGLEADVMILLAPATEVSAAWSNVAIDEREYAVWLSRAQALRARAYMADGAVGVSSLTNDGRLVSPWDPLSWHVISRAGDEVCATMRLTFHRTPTEPRSMGIGRSGIFSGEEGSRYLTAIESFQNRCFSSGGVLCEAGGWATNSGRRGGRRSAAVLLSCWPIARSQGRVHTLATVATRNRSHEMLTHLGARPLRDSSGELPGWEDRVYGCRMHLSELRSWSLNPEFEATAVWLEEVLRKAPTFLSAGRCPSQS
jgi:hypothetical protein